MPGKSVPPDEWGQFFSGPMPGYYEFRDVAPGSYTIRLTLPVGFHAPGEAADPGTGLFLGYVDQAVTIVGSSDFRHTVGINTLVPQAGVMEGGIFDDVVLDMRWYSSFSWEKQLQVGLGVIVRDYLGYALDTLVQPSGVCYPGTTPYDPAAPQEPYGAICDRPDLGQDVEIDRLVAPGLHLYWGNDPALPECNADRSNSPCFDPSLFNLELPYTMGQGLAKFEADWSLPPALGGGGVPPGDCQDRIRLIALGGSSSPSEEDKWSATVTVTVEDPLGRTPNAEVFANFSNGGEATAITGPNGTASLFLETVEGVASVTATITVTPGEGMGGTFQGTCGVGDCIVINEPGGGDTLLCGAAPAACGDGVVDPGEDVCNCPEEFADGTGNVAVHSDTDQVPDCADACPTDPNKWVDAGTCGCGTSDVDSDLDGEPDCDDGCPTDPAKTTPGACGCFVLEGTCGGCVQSGVTVASVVGESFPDGEEKWIARVTVHFEDTTCFEPVAMDLGQELAYAFTGGEEWEWKQEQSDGENAFIVFDEVVEEGDSRTFVIDHLEPLDWDGVVPDPITINRPE